MFHCYKVNVQRKNFIFSPSQNKCTAHKLCFTVIK